MEEKNTVDQYFTLLLKKENAAFDSTKHIILLTFDDNYVNQTINLIMSIAKYHPNEVSYICICPSLRQENVEALLSVEQGIRICCYKFLECIDPAQWPVCAMFRLFSPWLLEQPIKKVLYMDSDIICAGDIERLLTTNTEYVAMCPEIFANIRLDIQKVISGFLSTEIYCNSGVCILNLETLRREYTASTIFTALKEMRPKLMFPDQDFLNFYFRGRIAYLNSYMYNFIPYELKGCQCYKKALNNARLIHFASAEKPWKYKSSLYLIQIYLKHTKYLPMKKILRQSMWKSWFHSIIRLNRPIRRWYNDTFLIWKNSKKRK